MKSIITTLGLSLAHPVNRSFVVYLRPVLMFFEIDDLGEARDVTPCVSDLV